MRTAGTDSSGWARGKGDKDTTTFINQTGNSITIAFERTASDAERSADGQKLFAGALGSEIDELVDSESNVALTWDKVPSDEESEAVKSCLSEGGGPIPLVEQDSSSSESFEYTSEWYDAHFSGCLGQGFSETKCRCFMDWAQERYYAFQLEEDVLPNKDLVREVLDQCPA